MIYACPHCGYTLESPLKDGLTNCCHCNQVFDSSDYNNLLAAAWQCRKENLTLEKMKWQLQLDEDFCILVYTFAYEYNYTHEEFMALLKKLGVARKAYLDYGHENIGKS